MKWRTWIPLLIALVFGLVAVKLGKDILQQQQKPVDDGQALAVERVLVAARDLQPGDAIEADDLMAQDMATKFIPSAAFREAKRTELVKDRRVLVSPVKDKELLLEGMLAPPGTTQGLVALVPKGMRGVTIEVNESSGVAGLLLPGCHVDVISAFQDKKTGQPVSRTVVQDVEVKAVGQQMTVKSGSGKDETVMARSVTLLVTPKQAEAVELVTSYGRPRLVLRGKGDVELVANTGVALQELTGGVDAERHPTTGPSTEQILNQIMSKLQATTQPATQPVVVHIDRSMFPAERNRQRVVQVIRAAKSSNETLTLSQEQDEDQAVVAKSFGETENGQR